MKSNLIRAWVILLSISISFSVYAQKGKRTDKKNNVSLVYIPKNLNDCFKQLDSILTDSSKQVVRDMEEDNFSGKYHLGFGTWMRNSWGLWRGSRLSEYFNSLGIYHPEDMTGIIFDSYHRQLRGNEIRLAEQVKFYQDYWKKVDDEEVAENRKRFVEYYVSDTVSFRYQFGFVSKRQEKKYDNDICIAKGVITGKNDSTFSIKVRLLDDCDKRGIVSFRGQTMLVINKTTGKPERSRGRQVVEYIRAGQEAWFHFSYWEIGNDD